MSEVGLPPGGTTEWLQKVIGKISDSIAAKLSVVFPDGDCSIKPEPVCFKAIEENNIKEGANALNEVPELLLLIVERTINFKKAQSASAIRSIQVDVQPTQINEPSQPAALAPTTESIPDETFVTSRLTAEKHATSANVVPIKLGDTHTYSSVQHNTRVEQLNQWTLDQLPRLNAMVIAKEKNLIELVTDMNDLLILLPEPDKNLSVLDMQRLLVILGIWGSSVGRHYQEAYPETCKSQPDKGMTFLHVGQDKVDFREYFNKLAFLSGTGHPDRDAYASLVRWNADTMRAYWKDQVVAEIPGVFDDGCVRTYTDDVGEHLILELFKRCETLERAANKALEPLWNGTAHDLSNDDIFDRFNLATHMLAGIQRFMLEFPFGDERGKLTPDQFIDVFRQFAIHWSLNDVPPSGPQDTEFVKRDLMNGMGQPRYIDHVRRIFPGLLEEERTELSALFNRKALPITLLENAGMKLSDLETLSKDDLTSQLKKHPVIAYCYIFLRTNAHLSAAHLMLTKKFLFKPMRQRKAMGINDGQPPVSNEAGITDLTERILDHLNLSRKQHLLTRLDQFTSTELYLLTGVGRCPELTMEKALGLLKLKFPPEPLSPRRRT